MYTLFTLILLLTTTLAFPFSSSPSPPGDALLQTIYQFPNGTWVENLAVRSNGNILVTLINTPEIWSIDPHKKTAELVHKFDEAPVISAMGIAEVEKDVFVVNLGNFSDVTRVATEGSWGLWEVDLSGRREKGPWYHEGHKEDKVKVRKITGIPEATWLNGMTTLPTEPHTVLAADSGKGAIYRVDTTTGAYSTFIDDPSLKPNTSAEIILGVNGIHYQDEHLYFTNSFKTPVYGRFRIDRYGQKSGSVELIAKKPEYEVNGGAAADDFALDREGNAWLATASNTLVKIGLDGKQTVIAGGAKSRTLLGCTSTAFAKGGRGVLYITTDGGLADPELGIEGGKVLMLDTGRL